MMIAKIIMVNSCDAFGCTNRAGSSVSFHKIPCDKETQNVWLIALRRSMPVNLKHACVYSDHFQFWKRITSSITNWNRNYFVVIIDRGNS